MPTLAQWHGLPHVSTKDYPLHYLPSHVAPFRATQDEKALSFFLTVPQKWRLFWLMNMIGICFSLALVGVVHVGDTSAVENRDSAWRFYLGLEVIPSYFLFVMNPTATTFLSLCASRLLQAVCDSRTASADEARGVWFWKSLRNWVGAAAKALRLERGLYAVLFVWLVPGVLIGRFFSSDFPLAVRVSSSSSGSSYVYTSSGTYEDISSGSYEFIPRNIKTSIHVSTYSFNFFAANLVLITGLVLMAVRLARDRALARVGFDGLPPGTPGPRRSRRVVAEDHGDGSTSRHQRTRVPSLLVGWGLGYWLMSLLYVLGTSWPEGGWARAPLVVKIAAYILLPLSCLLGVFIVADSNFYGSGVERVLKPVADALADDGGVFHWMMLTVLRDVMSYWVINIIIFFYYPGLNIL